MSRFPIHMFAGLALCLSLVWLSMAQGQTTANTPMSTTSVPAKAKTEPSKGSSARPGRPSTRSRAFGSRLQEAKPKAIRTILSASRSDNPELRANALEAIQPLAKRALPLAQQGVDDPNPGVRFSALVTIGKLALRSLGPSAERYVDDSNASVRAAAIFAAHAAGRDVPMNKLPALLGSSDPQTRGNTAMILGMMDEPSAIKMLQDKADSPMRRARAVRKSLVDLQISEAIVKLGDEQGLGPIRAAAYSTEYEVRVMAVLTLGRLDDRRMAPALARMLDDQPIELELAAAQALAQMGDDRGLETMLAAARFDAENVAEQTRQFLEENPNSAFAPKHRGLMQDAAARRRVAAAGRAQAAFALSHIQTEQAAQAVVNLLDDPAARVRLAAAAATLQALDVTE